MNLWKKMRVIVFIGLGIFAVSAVGQEQDEADRIQREADGILSPFSMEQRNTVFSQPEVLAGFAQTIENEIEMVSRVSDLSVIRNYTSESGTQLVFTVTTTNGDVLKDFRCRLRYNLQKKRVMSSIELTRCGNAVARFEKRISIPIQKFNEFLQNDGPQDIYFPLPR